MASGGRTTTQNVSPAVGTRASVEVLLSGANGNRVEGSTEFIADQSGLVRLWRQLTGNASAPRVDFDTERVVAIFMGQRNTGGFGYRPGEASYTANGAIQVQILEIRPKPTDRVTQALTSPFIVLKLPKGTGQPSLLFLTP
ncbi:MAG TPA: hypothetical protein DCX65_04640 [Spirochaetaceae bacterium]|nr:hypothetical protein [Spirochaetaceae bacterium]